MASVRNSMASVALSVLVLTIACATWRCALLEDRPHPPTDGNMVQVFERFKGDFQKIVAMSDPDSNVCFITDDRTWLVNDVSWPRPESELGFSQERWQEYKTLFSKLGIQWLRRPTSPDGSILFGYYGWGLVTGGFSKYFVYSQQELAPLSPSL